MKHKELVKEAKNWLIRAKGCNPVFCEKGSAGCTEIPDAVGWTSDTCYVVECKASKDDLLRNSKKCLNLGDKRYFLMTKELFITCEKLIPEGWGVITVNGSDGNWYSRQERFRDSKRFESNLKHEISYLRSRILEVQRYGQ